MFNNFNIIQIKIIKETPCTAFVDGGNLLGTTVAKVSNIVLWAECNPESGFQTMFIKTRRSTKDLGPILKGTLRKIRN